MARKKTAVKAAPKSLRQALLPDKCATINFDPENILQITYNPTSKATILEDIPDNLRSEFVLGEGGGGAVTIEALNVTANGTYTAETGKAYSPVTVNVSGGSEPVIGLLTTINITEPVATIIYNLPQLALDYGTVWAEWDNVTYDQDYLYASIVSSTDSPVDSAGFFSGRSSINDISVHVGIKSTTINGVNASGFIGNGFPAGGANRGAPQSNFTPARFYIKLYASASRLNSGTIRLYGRVS